MPTKAVAAETMEIGKKGGGKHWTADEIAARKAAANSLKRKKVSINAPEYLSSGALFIWQRVMNDTEQVELLDNLDVDVLAMYCDAVDKYQTLSKSISAASPGDLVGAVDGDAMKMLQGWSRIITSCADKLGFTPGARARLIKKRAADPQKDKFGDQFD